MPKKKADAIQRFIKDVEANAARLRKDLQRFSKNVHLPHDLEELSSDLRRGAAVVAAEIEHYLHHIRRDLLDNARPRTAAKRRGSAKRKKPSASKRGVATKRPGTTKRGTARKTSRKKTAATRR